MGNIDLFHDVVIPLVALLLTGYAAMLRLAIGRNAKEIDDGKVVAQRARDEVADLRAEIADKYQRRDAAEIVEKRIMDRLDEIANLLHQLMLRKQ